MKDYISRVLILVVIIISAITFGDDLMPGNSNPNVEDIVLKITYFGSQNKTVGSLLFLIEGSHPPIEKLKTLKVFYGNDETLITSLYVSPEVLGRVVEVARSLVTKSSAVANDLVLLKVAIVNVKTDELNHYALDREQALAFFANLQAALHADPGVLDTVRIWGNRADLMAE